jgi:hypothetical protein
LIKQNFVDQLLLVAAKIIHVLIMPPSMTLKLGIMTGHTCKLTDIRIWIIQSEEHCSLNVNNRTVIAKVVQHRNNVIRVGQHVMQNVRVSTVTQILTVWTDVIHHVISMAE